MHILLLITIPNTKPLSYIGAQIDIVYMENVNTYRTVIAGYVYN